MDRRRVGCRQVVCADPRLAGADRDLPRQGRGRAVLHRDPHAGPRLQSVALKIGDRTLRDEARNIVSFEQASAVAVSMTDYVLELMRTAPHAGNDARAS